MRSPHIPEPEVFFLPLAVGKPERFPALDPWVLARRLPDFLSRVINQGELYPTALLELQTPGDEQQPVSWVRMEEPPEVEEAFDMMPVELPVRAVVTGQLSLGHEGLELRLQITRREDLELGVSTEIHSVVAAEDPVPALLKIAQHTARVLDLPFAAPQEGLITHNGKAFFHFLAGLDGSALISGDLEIEVQEDASTLMQPFGRALALDPHFGLALRAAHMTLASALEDARIPAAEVYRLHDEYLDQQPDDGDACVQVAEYLAVLGEEGRARAWLEHATHLDPPPPRSLENLGIICLHEGKPQAARNLWLNGLALDGHPNFYAHLLRLSFREDKVAEAWDKALRGLHRIQERSLRAMEWMEEDQELGLLLRYLAEHLAAAEVPVEVVDALEELRGKLRLGPDRIALGLCLLQVGRQELAIEELTAGLGGDLHPAHRDEGVRAMLSMQVEDFEARFAATVHSLDFEDPAAEDVDLDEAATELQRYLALQPEFWPAMFFLAMIYRRQGRPDEALDALLEVRRIWPNQPEALLQMAELFAERGNPKRALECVTEAMQGEPQEEFSCCLAMATYLAALDRREDALAAVGTALELEPDNEAAQALRARLED